MEADSLTDFLLNSANFVAIQSLDGFLLDAFEFNFICERKHHGMVAIDASDKFVH